MPDDANAQAGTDEERFGAIGDNLINRLISTLGIDVEKVEMFFQRFDPHAAATLVNDLRAAITKTEDGRLRLDLELLFGKGTESNAVGEQG